MMSDGSINLEVDSIVTCGLVARERVDKHVYMQVDSWRPTRYKTRFRVNEHSTNIS
jgi:hypothetical protein